MKNILLISVINMLPFLPGIDKPSDRKVFTALQYSDRIKIKQYVSRYSKLLTKRYFQIKVTLLEAALMFQNRRIAAYLINQNGTDLKSVNPIFKLTPLQLALYREMYTCADLLMKKKVPVDVFLACAYGKVVSVKKKIEKKPLYCFKCMSMD